MYFTVNTAFFNYLDQFPNLTESLEFPIIKNKTTFEQVLSISLNVSKFDPTLLTASSDLNNFIHRYTFNKEVFDLQERHDNMELNTNKNSCTHFAAKLSKFAVTLLMSASKMAKVIVLKGNVFFGVQ